jgi:hypothetical protein
MRSPAARLTVGAAALIVSGAAAFFVAHSEQQIRQLRARARAFDEHARETTGLLAELRVAQEAYVAAGQGSTFWMPRVAATSDAAARAVAALREGATSPDARTSLDQAATTIDEFTTVDQRARDYLRSGQDLMAADVVFTEGAQTAAAAGRQVEASGLAERQALDVAEAAVRKQEALALGGAGTLAALTILLLGVSRPDVPAASGVPLGRLTSPDASSAAAGRASNPGNPDSTEELEYARLLPPVKSVKTAEPAPPSASRVSSPLLPPAAELCTALGRVGNIDELNALLGRAAEVVDASGLIVWLGSTSGGDLRPVLAHGYPSEMLERMPAVPRSANNAAGTAYRTGTPQLVPADPGRARGAVVAPLLAADGCIGALSVETRDGGETSDDIQAIVGIFAAQLAGVLAVSAAEMAEEAPRSKAAQG